MGYGHLGDGNLHLNVSGSQYDDVVRFFILFFKNMKSNFFLIVTIKKIHILAETEPFVYEWTSKQYASISAEHGLGLMKAEKIYYSKSTATVSLLL